MKTETKIWIGAILFVALGIAWFYASQNGDQASCEAEGKHWVIPTDGLPGACLEDLPRVVRL